MRFRRVSLPFVLPLLFCLIGTPVAVAQKTESELAASYMGKTFFLRGLWQDGHLHFHADGQPDKNYRAGSFSKSKILVRSVKMDGHGVRIDGQRQVMVFDKDGHPAAPPRGIESRAGKVRIEVDGTTGEDYGPALLAVLAPDLKSLAPSLPEVWQRWVSKELGHPLPGMIVGGVRQSKPNDWIRQGIKAPKVISAPDPEFSEEARTQKFSGDVQVYLLVDEQGKPQAVSIVRPAGLGLDEKAVETVSQYRFRPATRNGQPVAVDLYININFQIF